MNKCPYCNHKQDEREAVYKHMETKHKNDIPKDVPVERIHFNFRNGYPQDYNGKCTECGSETGWNEKTEKYYRLCEDPRCKENVKERFEKRMMKVHGKKRLMDDPEHQQKMREAKGMSGEYKFEDGGMVKFFGSYEREFLYFIDKFLEIPSREVISPAPQIINYKYGGKKRFYQPDFYLQSLDLIVEVKWGDDNTHPGMSKDEEGKNKAKEKATVEEGFNYCKVINKDYEDFMDLLIEMKRDSIKDNRKEQYVSLGENLKFDTPGDETSNRVKVMFNIDESAISAMNECYIILGNDPEYSDTFKICADSVNIVDGSLIKKNYRNNNFAIAYLKDSVDYDIMRNRIDEYTNSNESFHNKDLLNKLVYGNSIKGTGNILEFLNDENLSFHISKPFIKSDIQVLNEMANRYADKYDSTFLPLLRYQKELVAEKLGVTIEEVEKCFRLDGNYNIVMRQSIYLSESYGSVDEIDIEKFYLLYEHSNNNIILSGIHKDVCELLREVQENG